MSIDPILFASLRIYEGQVIAESAPTDAVILIDDYPRGQRYRPQYAADQRRDHVFPDLRLLRKRRLSQESLMEKPHGVHQPQKRQETEAAQEILPAQTQLFFVFYFLQIHLSLDSN